MRSRTSTHGDRHCRTLRHLRVQPDHVSHSLPQASQRPRVLRRARIRRAGRAWQCRSSPTLQPDAPAGRPREDRHSVPQGRGGVLSGSSHEIGAIIGAIIDGPMEKCSLALRTRCGQILQQCIE